jgi:hypothetical protein
MPISMATGHAAGVCAALAARAHRAVRDVAGADVQRELVRQHADLGRINRSIHEPRRSTAADARRTGGA